jgi:diguanylate cyclase (GGDEF)-like protein
MTNALRLEEVNRLHVLRHVGLESVWALLEACPVCDVQAGEHVLRQGQVNQTMYLILSGELAVHLDGPEAGPVATLPIGETVGEISVIDDSPATASVVAARRSRLLAVDEETFWRLIQSSHAFATNMLLLLAQRMRANNFKISESMRLREKLERDAMVDGLTSVFNRRWLDERLPRFIRRFQIDASPISVLMVDVDFFKRFNDTYGHAAGDQVLIAVARTMAQCIRPTDYVVRYGGEEFVVVLPSTDQQGALITAERLRAAMSRATVEVEDRLSLPAVTVSIGAATLRSPEEAPALLARADQALYRAKQGGRNRVEGESC